MRNISGLTKHMLFWDQLFVLKYVHNIAQRKKTQTNEYCFYDIISLESLKRTEHNVANAM